MKQLSLTLRIAALTVLSVLSFASCKTVEEIDLLGEQFEDCTIIASLGPQTRTTNQGNSTFWSANDAITVLHKQEGGSKYYSSCFTYSGADDEFNGKVSSLSATNDWYTIYPYSSENVSADQIHITVLSEQTQNGNDNKAHFAGENFPLYGKELGLSKSTSISIAMKNALAGLKFKVTNTTNHTIVVKRVVMDAPVMVSGEFIGDLTLDEPVWTATASSSQQSILNVVGGSSIAAGEIGSFYLGTIPFVAPASSTISVTVETTNPDASDKSSTFTHEFELSNATSFKAGYEKTLNISYEESVAAPTEGYVLLTSEPSDWSGKYLVVSKDKSSIFTGATSTSNKVSLSDVDFDGDMIVKSGLEAYEFTITKEGENYYLQNGEYYVYCSGSAETKIGRSISRQALKSDGFESDGSFVLWGTYGATQYLYFNGTNFKFGSSGKGVLLYKYGEGSAPSTPAADKYVKVTAAPSEWDGTYLFVDETSHKAFATFSSNASSYAVDVTITDGMIISDGVVDKYALTVEGTGVNHANTNKVPAGEAYDIKNSEGKYVYGQGSAVQVKDTRTDGDRYFSHVFTFSNGNVQVISAGSVNGNTAYYLQYSSAFIYSSTQGGGVQLYKLTDGASGGNNPDPGTPGTDVPAGTVFNLENSSISSFFDAAESQYTDSNWNSVSVVTQYCSNSASNRKDTPKPVTLSWSAAAAGTKTVYIYNDAAKTQLEKSETTATYSVDIYNLIPNRTYYYTVMDSSNAAVASGSFATEGRRRLMKVSGTYGNDYANNCRDLGGMKTTDGKTLNYNRVFRGSNMSAIGNSELAVLYDYMGVRMDIDLRAPGWSGNSSYAGEVTLLKNKGVGYSNAGFNSTSDLSNPQKIKTTFTDIINTVTAGNACYIHCYVGADRTGYICMLLEAVLGVSPKDCSIDYEITSFSSVGTRDRTGKYNDYYFTWGMNRIQGYSKGNTFTEKAENILLDAGITSSQISAFRAAMLQ